MGTVVFLSSSALHPPTNMKFLVLAACVAVSSAQGFYGLQSHPNGAVTPIDEPAVAAARADHLATKFGAGLGYAGYAPGYAAGYGARYDAGYGYAATAPVATGYAGAYGYPGPLNLNTQLIARPNGAVVPLDEPAVAAARADHLATKGVYGGVYAAAGPVAYAAGYAPYAGLVAHPNGAVVPVDEPAVAAARANHLAAHGYQDREPN